MRDMAGAFLAGGSAALIAAFTAILCRGRRRFCTRKGRSDAEDGSGPTILLRDAKPGWRADKCSVRAIDSAIPAAENSWPRAIANRLRAACLWPPGVSGRSPRGKAAARVLCSG